MSALATSRRSQVTTVDASSLFQITTFDALSLFEITTFGASSLYAITTFPSSLLFEVTTFDASSVFEITAFPSSLLFEITAFGVSSLFEITAFPSSLLLEFTAFGVSSLFEITAFNGSQFLALSVLISFSGAENESLHFAVTSPDLSLVLSDSNAIPFSSGIKVSGNFIVTSLAASQKLSVSSFFPPSNVSFLHRTLPFAASEWNWSEGAADSFEPAVTEPLRTSHRFGESHGVLFSAPLPDSPSLLSSVHASASLSLMISDIPQALSSAFLFSIALPPVTPSSQALAPTPQRSDDGGSLANKGNSTAIIAGIGAAVAMLVVSIVVGFVIVRLRARAEESYMTSDVEDINHSQESPAAEDDIAPVSYTNAMDWPVAGTQGVDMGDGVDEA
jgi:hypothetical protein